MSQERAPRRVGAAPNGLAPPSGGQIVKAALALIFVATLFPFGLYPRQGPRTLAGVLERFELGLRTLDLTPESVANVLLFLPLGFGLSILFERRWRAPVVLGMAMASGLLLSVTIETIQLWFPWRVPSLGDIAANTLGALLGAALARAAGGAIRRALGLGCARLRGLLALLASPLGFGLYTLFVVLLAGFFLAREPLANWDPTYPLLLGNERTGDRPWRGRITELAFADVAIDPDRIARLISGSDGPDAVFGDRLVASYQLNGGTLRDLRENLPQLEWQRWASAVSNQGLFFDGKSWLISTGPVTELIERVRRSSQFTLVTTVDSASDTQWRRARIVTISLDRTQRNLTLSQNGSDLEIRLRTVWSGSNGAPPVVVVPAFFTRQGPHRLVLSYDSVVLSIYLDSVEAAYRVPLTPEITLLPTVLGRRAWRLRLGSGRVGLYRLVYLGCVFLPAGWLLAIAAFKADRRLGRWLLWAGLLVPPMLLEAVWASARGAQPVSVLSGTVLTGLGLLARLAWTRRSRNEAAA